MLEKRELGIAVEGWANWGDGDLDGGRYGLRFWVAVGGAHDDLVRARRHRRVGGRGGGFAARCGEFWARMNADIGIAVGWADPFWLNIDR